MSLSFVPSSIRGVFCGSGVGAMSNPQIAKCILNVVSKSKKKISSQTVPYHILYLGTAVYDIPEFYERQTIRFKELGCTTSFLSLVDEAPTTKEIKDSLEKADVVLVSGGNTLFAIDRWNKFNLSHLLKKYAIEKHVVLAGGSAGAICWFDGGHSDSMDPDSYKIPMKQEFQNDKPNSMKEEHSTAEEVKKDWKYIRVPGLGFFPGLLCPHHDQTQSNGVLRAYDFDKMMLQHPGEVGIGLDHWSALIVDGEHYEVLALDNKAGSVVYDEVTKLPFFSEKLNGVPGVWIKRVVKNENNEFIVESKLCPTQGKLSDILSTATNIVEDIDDLNQCRKENPDDGPSPKP